MRKGSHGWHLQLWELHSTPSRLSVESSVPHTTLKMWEIVQQAMAAQIKTGFWPARSLLFNERDKIELRNYNTAWETLNNRMTKEL